MARDDAGVAGWRRLLLFALSGAVLVTSFLVGRPTVSYADGVPQAVVAWGRNSWGEATVPQGLIDVKAISATAHSMVLRSNGTVYSWGHDKYGETDVPAGLSDVAAIAAGGFHSMALKSDGTLVEWGQNDYGQATVPTGLGHVAAISGGRFHSLALRDDGTVAAWGDNEDGQSTVPAGLHDVVAIDGGGFHSLALLRDGTVVAWGANEYGQSTVPSGLHDVVAIAAGWYHSMALKSDGTVVAWGQNTYGQATVPAGLPPVAYISAGATHSLVAFRDGTVATWGDNAWGQMEVPGGLTGVTRITGKAMHSMVMADDPPPSPVTNLTASIVTSSKVTLTWGYPAEPSDHDIDRIVVRGAAGVVAPASVTDGVEVPTGRPLTTLVNDLSGLQPGQRYSYSVFAVDRAGNVGMPASVTVPVSFREPVTDAAATVESSTSVSLSWKNPANDQLKKIIVRRAVGSVAPASETSGANVSLSSALAESVTNTGLLSGTQYSYSIFAQDRVGNVSVLGTGSTVTVTTTAQPSPSPTPTPSPTPGG